MTSYAALVIVTAMTAATTAFAQSAAVSVPQLSAPERRGVAATAQADTAAAANTRREREALVSAGAPIGEGRRTAEASPALSTRAEGRAVRAAPVGGQDRCDAPGQAETHLCRDRLEARAGAFDKPGAAPVTAEGRLLVLTDPQPGAMSVNEATRRLGVDSLAGGAAGELAGAISSSRSDGSSTANGTGSATGGASAATALPAGVPAVVLTPR